MASSSCFAFVSVAGVLHFLLLVSASASTSQKYIDPICENVFNKNVINQAFCVKTLKSYPPIIKATNQLQAAEAVFGLIVSYAEKSAGFTEKAATKNPNLKKQFKACQNAYEMIKDSVKNASGDELKTRPDLANYEVMIGFDQTTILQKLVGKNRDKASQTILKMALMMEKLIGIGVGATVSVGG